MRGGAVGLGSMRGGPVARDLGIIRLTSLDGSITINPPSGDEPVEDLSVAPDPNQFVFFQTAVAVPNGGVPTTIDYNVPPAWVRFVTTPAFLGAFDAGFQIEMAQGLDLYAVIRRDNADDHHVFVDIYNNSPGALNVDIAVVNFRSA